MGQVVGSFKQAWTFFLFQKLGYVFWVSVLLLIYLFIFLVDRQSVISDWSGKLFRLKNCFLGRVNSFFFVFLLFFLAFFWRGWRRDGGGLCKKFFVLKIYFFDWPGEWAKWIHFLLLRGDDIFGLYKRTYFMENLVLMNICESYRKEVTGFRFTLFWTKCSANMISKKFTKYSTKLTVQIWAAKYDHSTEW